MKRWLFLILAVAFLAAPVVALPGHALAVSSDQSLCEGSGGTWTETNPTTHAGTCNEPGKALTGQNSFLNDIINTTLFIAGALAVLMLISGGIRYITSTGDANLIKQAKDTVLYSVVGLIVVILAYAIVNFVIGSLK